MSSLCRAVRAALVLSLFVGSAAYAADAPSQEQDAGRKTTAVGAADDPLLKQVQEAIDLSSRRYLSAEVHSPWQILHALLALRQNLEIKVNGEKTNAVEWLSREPMFRGKSWFEKTPTGGRARPFTRPYEFEGHPDQFLAILGTSALPVETRLGIPGGEHITVGDLVVHAQREVRSGVEVTWTLWALVNYLGPDAQWHNKQGEAWSIERLVRMQIQEPTSRAACGGTHGLFALTFARNKYLHTGRPLRGVWLEADQRIERYIQTARSLQNSDGTFSTNFFTGKGHSADFETRVGTSGHTLEFLMLALRHKQLEQEWVRKGIGAVASDLIAHRSDPIECGQLYHALDALIIYRDRMQAAMVAQSREDAAKAKESAGQPQTEAPQTAAGESGGN